MSQKISRLLIINAVLFVLAAGLSIYMTKHHYAITSGEMGFEHSFCSISGKIDCDDVLGSSYAEILGVPLTVFSTAFYLLSLVLCVMGARDPFVRREALAVLVALTGVSVLVSVATFVISFFILSKICLLCGTLQVTNLVVFALAFTAWRAFIGTNGTGRELAQSDRKRVCAFGAAGLVIFGACFVLLSLLKVERMPLADPEKFVDEFRQQKVVSIDVGNSPKEGFLGDHPPLLLVEFADFQCPACGWAARFMHRLVPQYKDKIQLVFKNFPLNSSCNPFIHVDIHQNACVAAMAGYCAKKQGKFAEMYEMMFGHQEELSRDKIGTWATELGLDMKAFDECIPSDEARNAIIADEEQATKLGLESTPTFFANGRMVRGAIDEARLKLIMREYGI